jgi:hypothetical protein
VSVKTPKVHPNLLMHPVENREFDFKELKG